MRTKQAPAYRVRFLWLLRQKPPRICPDGRGVIAPALSGDFMPDIVLDGLGGDHFPSVVLPALKLFLSGHPDTGIFLSTTESAFADLQNRLPEVLLSRVHWLKAEDAVDIGENPVAAIRSRPNCSIMVAMNAVREGKAKAVVSYGHTGATMAAAHLALQSAKEVNRPGLAALMPTARGSCLLLDVGANLKCKAEHLLQYGIMGSTYASEVLKIARPKVGLLNVGAEQGKGDKVLNTAHNLLRDNCKNFIGNVEGYQVFDGTADVVVCNGMTGNAVLKSAESLAEMMTRGLLDELRLQGMDESGLKMAETAVKSFGARHHANHRGVGRLLGVSALVFAGHGNAREEGVARGLEAALIEQNAGLQLEFSRRLSETTVKR